MVDRRVIPIKPNNIIIGKPLIELDKLGITDDEVTVYENEEVFIPRILKKYGFFLSTSQVKKNREDLWREVVFPSFEQLEIGHDRLCIIVGIKGSGNMDIYKYRDDTLDKLENMSDEEFVNMLKEVGVNCKLDKRVENK